MTQPQTNAQLAYSLGAVSAGLQQMQASVASGSLQIDPESGTKLEAALTQAFTASTSIMNGLGALSHPASLGTNAVSGAITEKFVGRADGTGTALAPMLQQYRDLLNTARAAVTASMSAYRGTDGNISADLHGK